MKKKQSTSMEDHGSLRIRYLDGESNRDFYDKNEYEISSILLELSHPVVFSSDSLCLPKWGRTKKRSTSALLKPPEPVIKSLPSTEVTSSSSCLTGEAKKTNSPQTVESLETGLLRAHMAFVAHQPIDDQNMHHLQPLTSVDRRANVRDVETASSLQEGRDNLERRGFDLNLPAAEEGNHIAANAMVGFQRVETKVKAAAAHARQRRLALMRSKKLYNRFISSSYQFN